MGFEDVHQRRVASFPYDIRFAHTKSSNHRSELLASDHCGCFYCCKTFSPHEIIEWIDDIGEVGQTALCP